MHQLFYCCCSCELYFCFSGRTTVSISATERGRTLVIVDIDGIIEIFIYWVGKRVRMIPSEYLMLTNRTIQCYLNKACQPIKIVRIPHFPAQSRITNKYDTPTSQLLQIAVANSRFYNKIGIRLKW